MQDMYVIKNNNGQFYTDDGVGLLWGNKLVNAQRYTKETADAIVTHWKKYNTVLGGIDCNKCCIGILTVPRTSTPEK